ncbi:MAG: helix-turn-helix domain-containing protein [Xanthobacteraceae bacterium]|jgi:excisionase family DNA binding protein
MSEQNFTVPEAAAWLRVSKTTLRLMLKERRLAYSKIGRRVVIQLRDLQALLDGEARSPQVHA